MERVIANRRMRIIAGHLTAEEAAGKEGAAAHSSSVTRVSPLNCSSTLNYVGRRCDNRVLFARQGSITQARFMRQVSVEEDFGHDSQENAYQKFSDCKDSEPLFARQENVYLKFSGFKDSEPLFARPAKADVGEHQSVKKEYVFSVVEPPAFGKATTELIISKQPTIMKIGQPVFCDGFKWSPRVDVADSGCDYTVTVELPGLNMNDIRIEFDNQSLIVTGKQPIQRWIAANVSVNSYPLYHQRDILQGPYQVVWPLPGDVNKRNVSADFV
ncbi:hypothetical protein ACLOJK_008683 [Asimina triloba]